jgi:hypothetical protein
VVDMDDVLTILDVLQEGFEIPQEAEAEGAGEEETF